MDDRYRIVIKLAGSVIVPFLIEISLVIWSR